MQYSTTYIVKVQYLSNLVSKNRDWTYILYERYPYLELPFLEALIPQSRIETNGISRILKKYKITSGGKILDFSCGIGRHSIELAKKGFNVVGYDPSEFYIDYANKWLKKEDPKHKLDVKFIHGDTHRISENMLASSKFEAALIMGNTIGIRGEDYDRLILETISEVLEIGSILIIEFENRDYTLRNFQSNIHYRSKDIEVFEEWKFDPESSNSQGIARYYEQDKSENTKLQLRLELVIKLRLYSLHEMLKMLKESNWSYLASYEGIINQIPIRNENLNIVVVASKDF